MRLVLKSREKAIPANTIVLDEFMNNHQRLRG